MKRYRQAAIAVIALTTPIWLMPHAYSETGSSTSITNGSMILLFNGDRHIGTCSSTSIEKGKLLTAGHCGHVGAKVKFKGKEIGVVESSGLRQGYDIIQISLNPSVKNIPNKANLKYIPMKGDYISKEGWRTAHTEGTAKTTKIKYAEKSHESINAPFDGKGFDVSTWPAELHSLPGDSGGPVLHNGKVVGLVRGGPNSEITTVTPLGDALKSLHK